MVAKNIDHVFVAEKDQYGKDALYYAEHPSYQVLEVHSIFVGRCEALLHLTFSGDRRRNVCLETARRENFAILIILFQQYMELILEAHLGLRLHCSIFDIHVDYHVSLR